MRYLIFRQEPNIVLFSDFPYGMLFALARNLLYPNEGDVRFECPSEDGSTKYLYAHSTILKARSNYYALSKNLNVANSHIAVFSSSFSEGDAAFHKKNASKDPYKAEAEICRRRIVMEEDFDVVHNVMFYLYTDTIILSNTPNDAPESHKLPKVCDTEAIYALAHRLQLETLQTKILQFLEWTCEPSNIGPRALGKFASIYEEVGTIYGDYFKKHWSKFRDMPEFKEYLAKVQRSEDKAEAGRIFNRYRELVREMKNP